MASDWSAETFTEHLRAEGYEADAVATINRWLARGDGAAVYVNQELGHPMLGHVKITSYGSAEAQLETDEPPQRLPDIGASINWRYQLSGMYRGAEVTL